MKSYYENNKTKFSDDPVENAKAQEIFRPLNSADELRDWMDIYFDIRFPKGVVYPASTHGPVDAMWRIYELFKTGKTADVPQVVMVSARDAYKTLSASAIEVLLFLHFRLPMAHAAAIKFQAGAAVKYVNTFFRKVQPYLIYHGWKKTSDNKTLIEWQTNDGDEISLTVLTASREGMNSRHVPLLCLDELDLMDPAAFSESRLVPSVYKNFSPLIIILSTRKFAAGLMEQEIERTPTIGGEVFKWNIIDVASAIPPEISRPDLPKVERYVTSKLPMSNLSPAQFRALSADEQAKYDQFFAYAGIAEHPLLPVMRNYLADRNQEDSGGLYKPLTAVHNNFKLAHDPDWAEAQLLGNKPTSSGLVYPRFEVLSNTISIVDMYEKIMGEKAPEDLDIDGLRTALVGTGIEFIGGADWGYTDYTSLVVIAITPTGDAYIVDNYLSPQLELDDIAVAMGELDRAWGVTKWYVDQAYPAYIATLRRKGFKLPEFTKNVGDGIAAVQYKICDSTGKRRLFVLDTPNTHDVIKSFGQYRWSINNKGEVIEGKPYHGRDNGGISDIQDSIRYPFQVLFSKSGKKPTATVATQAKPERITFGASAEEIKRAHSNQLMSHVHGGNIPKPVTHTPSTPQAPENTGQKKKKGVFWSI